MTRTEMLLTQLGEECAEVIQEISKCLRFGNDEIYAEKGISNIERVNREINDVFAIVEMLEEARVLVESPTQDSVFNRRSIEAKKIKVEKMLTYSTQCGRLNPTTERKTANE